MKKRKIILLLASIILLGILIFLITFGRALPSKIFSSSNKGTNYLLMNTDMFYRQTINNCGPYSVMAVTNILKNEINDPEKLSKEMTWRIYKNLTFPQGVVNLLHKYKVRTKEFNLNGKSDNKKIDWLKTNIDNGKPVVLLIKIHHVLHYVTVLGYDEKGFMLYDSMQEKNPENQRKTIIDENAIAGNRYYTNMELINLWNDGGYKIFFKNWAIVCSI